MDKPMRGTGRRAVVVCLMVAIGLTGAGCASAASGTTATPAPAPSNPASGVPSSASSTRPSATQPAATTPSSGTPSATTPSPTPFDSYTAYVTVSRLNLRQGASGDAEVSGQLTRADKVTVTGADRDGYTPIRHDGDEYWVSAGYLSTTKPDPLPEAVKAPIRTLYTTTRLNVRSQQLAGAEVLGTLDKDAQVTTAGAVAGDWTSISYQGQTGWVLSTYLTATKPKPATPSPSASAPAPGVALDKRCLTGLVICISKTDRELRLVQDGKILISLDARFGSEAGPTREGTFQIGWRSKDWVSTLYGSKMPYAMFFSGGEAIHYSSDFAARGYDGNSHGCVNIRSMDGIKFLWDHAPVGTTVVVYR
ncbi:MAG: SH3 domain-containing protein [Acidipropionibacterium sp.]|jgi:uncharacterized protein YgiM (DUF1202 family)|nr:SH3 domain-containing protein [Acidipropionibacterium sp.]